MKKWLIWCLTVLAMVCLIPGIALNAKAESLYCRYCDKFTDCEILGYEKFDSTFHMLHIRCKSCKKENDIIDAGYSEHTGGTETPTCTTGKTCEKCGAEYGVLGHDWGAWTSDGDGTHGTHTRRCTRCDKEETESCSGGATCTSPGVCATCGGSYYGGHKWVNPANSSLGNGTHRTICLRCGLNGTASCSGGYATCTSPGVCATCGGSYYGGHAWGEWSSAGDGTHTRSCKRSNCDAVENESCSGGTGTFTCTKGKTCEKCRAEYGILGHKWGDWTPNYNGTHGTHTRRCTRCNAEETGSCSGGYADCTSLGMCSTCGGCYYGGHDWGEWTPIYAGTTYTHARSCKNCPEVDTANCTGGTATCSAKAVCEVCGGKYGEKDPNKHAFVYHQAKPATCKEIGWDAYRTCSRCDYTDYVELPALENHDLRQYVTKAPTCTEIGFAFVRCWRCDYSTSQVLPALNHDLEQHAAKAPTCTEKGWNAYETCTRSGCNYTTYVELPAQHDLKQHEAKAPTCTEIGWDAYDTCSRCDYTTYAKLPALNHDLEQHEAKAPTCTGIGWNTYNTCSRCDYTTYAELPALNHDLEQHEAKAPTCTGIGWDAYDTCSRCDYTTRKELPALNHALVQHEAKAPTCTEIGWNAYETCSRCDYTTYAELSALNHDYQAVTVDPTCEADGYTVFTCSRCKDSYTANPTDRLGHQFGAWSPNGTGSQSASCLRDGCAHTGNTDCRKFNFRTAEGEALTFCPVCGQAENAAQLEMIEAATAWTISGSLSAKDVTARTNGEYLSVAFETAGSLTQPTGRVRLALPAGLLEGKTLVRIAPDGTQTEMPFETKNGKIILTLNFANSELPVMLFRLVPQPTAL